MDVDRRTMVQWLVLGGVWVAGCGGKAGTGVGADSAAGTGSGPSGTSSPGTSDSDDTDDTGAPVDCVVTEDVEGPYYTAGAPERGDLVEADTAGTPLTISGRVLDATDCSTPLAGAVFDVWHADDSGEYDNEGYRLRGRVVCDADGRFTLRTVMPGRYDTRPVRHLHFKVWVGETERVTSQLYFRGDEEHDPARHVGPLLDVDASGTAEVVLGV